MNTIPDKSSQLVTELPYRYDHHHHLSDVALRYLLITLGPIINISSLLSELCTLHTPYIAGTMLVAGAGVLVIIVYVFN